MLACDARQAVRLHVILGLPEPCSRIGDTGRFTRHAITPLPARLSPAGTPSDPDGRQSSSAYTPVHLPPLRFHEVQCRPSDSDAAPQAHRQAQQPTGRSRCPTLRNRSIPGNTRGPCTSEQRSRRAGASQPRRNFIAAPLQRVDMHDAVHRRVGGRQIATRHDASTMQICRHVNRTPHVPTIGAIVLQHQQQALAKR